MKLLIIDKQAKIELKQSTLRVDLQKIPLHLIETIIIIGSHNLDSKLLINLSSQGIIVMLLYKNFSKSSIIYPIKSKNAELKMQQYKAITNKQTSLNIAKYIVKNKILSHIKQLKKHNINIEYDYSILDKTNNLQEILGIEGSFAKKYFEYYFSLLPKNLHSGKRTKQPPKDPVNALLSLYYTMFYNIITIRVIGFGFEPTLGFLHQPFRSHNALSSDIIELIRADINEFVYKLFKNKTVTTQDFTKKNGVFLKYDSRKKLWKEFQTFQNNISPKIDSIIADIRSML